MSLVIIKKLGSWGYKGMRTFLYAVSWLAMLLLPQLASAAEVSLESEVRVTTQYDDNARLLSKDTRSAYGGSVRPKIKANIMEAHWDVAATVDLRFNKYDQSSLDSNDQFIYLDMNRRTENHSFGLTADIIRDSTLTSEVDTSGRVESAERRESYTLSPSWIYFISPNNQLQSGVSFNTVDYKEDEQFTPYDYTTIYSAMNHRATEKLSLIGQVGYNNYKPDDRGPFDVGDPYPFEISYGNETKSYTMQLGADYNFTEKITLGVLLGSTYTDATYDIQERPVEIPGTGVNADCNLYKEFALDPAFIPGVCTLEDYSSTSLTGEISLSREGERSDFEISYDVSDQPTSQGYVTRAQRLNFEWNYQITEAADIRLDMIAGKNKAVDTSVSDIDPENSNREFVTLVATYNYHFLESWWLNINGRLRWQDRETAVDDATGHGVRVGLTYRPRKTFF